MYVSMSRLSRLDAKWVDLFDATNRTFFAPHHNPYYELIVVADGTVYLEVEGERFTLKAGDSFLLMPWETHGGWNPDERQGTFFWVQFSCEPAMHPFMLDQASELNIVHAERTELRITEAGHEDSLVIPRRLSVKERFRLLGLFEELMDTFVKPNGYFRFQATIKLSEMLCLIANDLLEQKQLDIASPSSYLTFRRLVNFLNNAYTSDFPKELLERSIDRKYEYLCQLFKKYANTGIQIYIHQLRTQRAKHLLRHTSKSVKDIAQEVGYSDPFYFSRIFKKIEGVAPQHYRDSNASVAVD